MKLDRYRRQEEQGGINEEENMINIYFNKS